MGDERVNLMVLSQAGASGAWLAKVFN